MESKFAPTREVQPGTSVSIIHIPWPIYALPKKFPILQTWVLINIRRSLEWSCLESRPPETGLTNRPIVGRPAGPGCALIKLFHTLSTYCSLHDRKIFLMISSGHWKVELLWYLDYRFGEGHEINDKSSLSGTLFQPSRSTCKF